MTMTHLDRRAEVVADAVSVHPAFAAAAADGDTPLLDLVAVLPEGLDPVDRAAVSRQVDFLAYLTDRAAAGARDPARRLAALRRVLAEEEGFRGEEDDSGHPRNSYVERVLERRRGLPITLAVIYQAAGERLGWPVAGVNLPRHFLTGYWAEERL
ncbi:MAG: hypothetical protein HYU66_03780, partial [Armatimonadetes bacterium]|nr:hypothetical protein [Armatimonadota bacterium]